MTSAIDHVHDHANAMTNVMIYTMTMTMTMIYIMTMTMIMTWRFQYHGNGVGIVQVMPTHVPCYVITFPKPGHKVMSKVKPIPMPYPVDTGIIKVNTLTMPMPEPIFNTLTLALREEIESSVKKIGMYATAQKYAEKAGMSFWGLYNNLKKKVNTGKIETKEGIKSPFIRTTTREKKRKPQKLSEEEKIFLEDLKSGKKDISEISKLVAVKVFEKMLKYPDDFKFYDFYQSQLLQLKQEEQKSKNTIAQELINRLFSGRLPPTHCPKCGTEIIKIETITALEEGEIVKDD